MHCFLGIRRPQRPASLVEALASEGYVTPDEADSLRAAILIRNAAVHGSPVPDVEAGLLDRFLTILKTLADILRRPG